MYSFRGWRSGTPNRKKKRQAATEQEYEVAQAEGIAVDRRGVVEGRDGVTGGGGASLVSGQAEGRREGHPGLSFFVAIVLYPGERIVTCESDHFMTFMTTSRGLGILLALGFWGKYKLSCHRRYSFGHGACEPSCLEEVGG